MIPFSVKASPHSAFHLPKHCLHICSPSSDSSSIQRSLLCDNPKQPGESCSSRYSRGRNFIHRGRTRTDLRPGCQDVGCRMSVCSVDVAMLTPDPDQYFLFHTATALSRHPRDIPCEGWDMTGMFNCQHIRPVYLVMLAYSSLETHWPPPASVLSLTRCIPDC